MLTAQRTATKERIEARFAERDSAPFHCPECYGEVILKKGRIRIHHFAHKPPFDCWWGVGESEAHRYVKSHLYDALVDYPAATRVGLEEQIEVAQANLPLIRVRPDVRAVISRRYPVAIEVQRTPLPIEDIVERTVRYDDIGVYVLWVSPDNPPPHGAEFRVKAWQRYLHALYYGRFYYWLRGSLFLPVHFGQVHHYVEEFDSSETGPVGGYDRRLKGRRKAHYGRPVHIDEFKRLRRADSIFAGEHYTRAKLWQDRQGKFWESSNDWPDPSEGSLFEFNLEARPGGKHERLSYDLHKGMIRRSAECNEQDCAECRIGQPDARPR